jgi:hypothetical protein
MRLRASYLNRPGRCGPRDERADQVGEARTHREANPARVLPIALIGPDGIDLRSATPEQAEWDPTLAAGYPSLPSGRVTLWGLPFELGPPDGNRWLWLGPGARPSATVRVGAFATHVLLAQFAVPAAEGPEARFPDGSPSGIVARPGEVLARYAIDLDDGATRVGQLRRRFEINDVQVSWGQIAFGSRPHRSVGVRNWRGPHDAGQWGVDQTGMDPLHYPSLSAHPNLRHTTANYWLCTLENPRPTVKIRQLTFEATGSGLISIAGVVLFNGMADPLRHGPRTTILIETTSTGKPEIAIDLGVVANAIPALEDDATSTIGWGGPATDVARSRRWVVEFAAAKDARLHFGDEDLDLRSLEVDSSLRVGFSRITFIPAAERLVDVEVVDARTGEPMPSRVHFASDGRYLPPIGHRQAINDRWLEDYGADLLLGSTSYAYVEGRFQIRLPAADVDFEIVRGFEYSPLRGRIDMRASHRALRLEIQHPIDTRQSGWISADTHVHFISPDTAGLEGAAEGLGIVNILAAQWGDLFTNVGDYGDPGAADHVSTRHGVIVRVGSENRQHLLGHLSMLGKAGLVPARLSAAGPDEDRFGGAAWTSLAAWADECHAAGGLVIAPHFPNPVGEAAADVILGKIDAVELRDFWWGIDTNAIREWYRLLNCGARVAAAGGTDKMSAAMPVGGVRTYANVGEMEQPTFEDWAAAVRRGRSVTSSGPILDLQVDGFGLGDEIAIDEPGAIVDVVAVATSVHALEFIEIVHNGRVVARATGDRDTTLIRLQERLSLGPGWVAARCQGYETAWHLWPVRQAAHTSPIYLGRRPTRLDLDDVAHLNALFDGGITWLDRIATHGDELSSSQIRAVFERARDELALRLKNAP